MTHQRYLIRSITIIITTISIAVESKADCVNCGLDGRESNDIRNISLDLPDTDYYPNSPNDVTVIDFESFEDGQDINGLNLGGVTLTNPGNGIVEIFDDRCGAAYHSPTKAVSPGECGDTNYPLVGVFDYPAMYIGLWAGDAGNDIDSWELEAFDAPVGGNSLGIVTSGDWDGQPYRNLEISAPNIWRFEARWTGSEWPVAYDDLEFLFPISINKDSDVDDDDCVSPGRVIDYTISYDIEVTSENNVIITDYLPAEVEYNGSLPFGDFNEADRTVTWDLGVISPPVSGQIELFATVKDSALPGHTIVNVAEVVVGSYSKRSEEKTFICYSGDIEPNVICVDRDAINGNKNGTSWDDAFLDLNDALTESPNYIRDFGSCEIWVAAGPYEPNYEPPQNCWDATFRIPEGNIAIRGHFGGIGRYETNPDQRDFNNPAFETILDGHVGPGEDEKANNVVTCDDIGAGLILDGFTVTGAGYRGIYINYYSDPSITRSRFKNNSSYGIYADNYSYPDVADCEFLENSGPSASVGIYSNHSAWPYVKNCVFDGNNHNYYGLQGVFSEMIVEDCVIKRQTNSGIYFDQSHLNITGCKIEDNLSNGIYCTNTSLEISESTVQGNGNNGILMISTSFPTINNNIICNNKHHGIYSQSCESIIIRNNCIYHNGDGSPSSYDSGLYFVNSISPPLVRNNTIVGNSPYGIYVALGRDPCLINDIVWQNGSEPNKNIVSERGLEGIKATYCCIEGGFPGMGNISCNPGFRNPDANDYHLRNDSNCIDAGDPLADYEDETDIDGEFRIFDGDYNGTFIVDIGADEMCWPKADYNLDEVVDFIDFTFLADAWGSSNSPSISLDADIDVDIYDLFEFCNDWLWISPSSQFYEQFYSRAESNSKSAPVNTTLSVGQGLIEAPAMVIDNPIEDMSVYAVDEESTPILDETTGDESIEKLIDWLEKIWQSEPDLQEMMDPNVYERVIESLKEELDEL